MYPRSHNKSTTHLLSDEPLTLQQQEHSNLSKDIYYQHIKNKQVYNQIRSINPYFHYTLKNRIKNDNNDINASIREHNSLLEEYAYLINCQQKYRFHAESISRQVQSPLAFLKDIWNKKQSNHLETSNEERIDRLNKNIAFIKTNVNQMIHKCNGLHKEKYEEKELIYSTKQFQQLAQQYKMVKLQLEQIKQDHSSSQSPSPSSSQQNERPIQDVLQECDKYKQQIKRLQETNTKLTSLNKTMLSKINKLTQQIMQKDKDINQLKITANIIKRYESQTLNSNRKPLFQITVKQNAQDAMNSSHQFNKTFSSIVFLTKQSLDMIVSFIEDTTFQQKIADPFNLLVNDNNLSIISMFDGEMEKGKDLQDLIHQIDGKQNQISFSYMKAQKENRNKKRQLLYNPRLVLGAHDDNLNMSKDLKFVRRK